MATLSERVTTLEKDVVQINTRLTGIDGRLKNMSKQVNQMDIHIADRFDKVFDRFGANTWKIIGFTFTLLSIYTLVLVNFLK